MIRAARQSSGLLRCVCLTLAMFAVALKIVVPPGFMAAPSGDLPFPLVLCTSQGAVVVGHSQPDKAPDDGADHVPCVFAASAAGAPAPDGFDVVPVAYARYEAPAPRAFAPAPGRGLAAPPPPSTGPPVLLT